MSFILSGPPLCISIHALREEGDAAQSNGGTEPLKFLSTPSARRATQATARCSVTGSFLSTPSARRATLCENFNGMTDDISIHALREEGDCALSFWRR